MALIKSQIELKAHLGGIQKNANFATWTPFIQQAEIKYMIPFLGEAFYAELDVLHNGGGPNAIQSELISRLGRALSYYTLLEALPMLNIHVGELGVVQQSDSENTATPATAWSYNKAEHQASTNADRFFDNALDYLQLNVDSFATYKASDNYSDKKELLIESPKIFDDQVSIGKSRRTFLLLLPHLKRVQSKSIRSKIGAEMYDELITQKKADALTPANRALINEIIPALANLTMFEALPYLSVQINGNGIHVINENENVRQKLQAGPNDKSILLDRLLKAGESDLNGVQRFLYANISDYATFSGSSTYVPDTQQKPYEHPSQEGR
jgi:hypothetical protein